MTQQAPHFYNFPITETTVNINTIMCFGYFDTYVSRDKDLKVSQPMIKFFLPSLGGHPYNLKVTDEEMNNFNRYMDGVTAIGPNHKKLLNF